MWCNRAAALASRWNRINWIDPNCRLSGQDLQGHVTAEALLHGLVDDPHAAPADLAEDPIVAQSLGRGPGGWHPVGGGVGVPISPLPNCSIITRVGNSSRISSARSG